MSSACGGAFTDAGFAVCSHASAKYFSLRRRKMGDFCAYSMTLAGLWKSIVTHHKVETCTNTALRPCGSPADGYRLLCNRRARIRPVTWRRARQRTPPTRCRAPRRTCLSRRCPPPSRSAPASHRVSSAQLPAAKGPDSLFCYAHMLHVADRAALILSRALQAHMRISPVLLASDVAASSTGS